VTRIDPYDLGLGKNGANYVPLSPLSFIERAARVYPDQVATIHVLAVAARIGRHATRRA
jgi:fatty-acyl-CoA synthase